MASNLRPLDYGPMASVRRGRGPPCLNSPVVAPSSGEGQGLYPLLSPPQLFLHIGLCSGARDSQQCGWKALSCRASTLSADSTVALSTSATVRDWTATGCCIHLRIWSLPLLRSAYTGLWKSPSTPSAPPGSEVWTLFAMGDSMARRQKENLNDLSDRKRKLGGGEDFGARLTADLTAAARNRQAFAAVNAARESCPVGQAALPPSAGEWEGISTNSADVQALLNMKMNGKNKFDYKGRSEQMMEYIKKLRACIRHFQEVETGHLLEKEQMQQQLENDKENHDAIELAYRRRQAELESKLEECIQKCSELAKTLAETDAQKEALMRVRQKDAESLQAAVRKQSHLSDELGKAEKELATATQQVGSLQDINKRLQEYNASLQQYNCKLQADGSAAAEAIARIQKEKAVIMETLSTLRGHSASLQSQLDSTKASLQEVQKQKKILIDDGDRLRVEIQRVIDERDQYVTQNQVLAAENALYKECTGRTAADLDLAQTKAAALEESCMSQSDRINTLRLQLDIASRKYEEAQTRFQEMMEEASLQRTKAEELQARLTEAEQRVIEGELLRKKLHNTILELKGNIRVFCRVRPILPEDEETAELPIVQYPNSVDLFGRGIELLQPQGSKHSFSFDKVFGPEAKQDSIFVEISQLVQSALDGYKVCIFAYGQTGSGKTHTMMGNPNVREDKGVIPRALEQVFQSSKILETQGWSFKMQASMLEIYNETIRDLLVSPRGAVEPLRNDPGNKQQYIVKHDPSGNTVVSDLTVVEVVSWKEVSSLLHRASQSRTVGKTAMNEQSSRSHCVFTLRISGSNESTEQQVQGVLNMIDLAGSERLSRSGAVGDRLKETQAINKSLSSLGDVIMAIGNKEQHIPYRNSKLTYLLQPCLGGDSKTLMFVNISPDTKSLNESLCSLRFAAKVNACEIGVPRRQTLSHTFTSPV